MNAAATSKTVASHRLIKSGKHWGHHAETNHIAAVMFSVKSDGTVWVATYATWTDYGHTDPMSREAAREEWKRLRADGWEHDKDWTPLAA